MDAAAAHSHKDAHLFQGGDGKRARALRGWAAGRGTRTPDICKGGWEAGWDTSTHTRAQARTQTHIHLLTGAVAGKRAGAHAHIHKDAHAFRGGAGKRARALRGWAVGRGAQQLCPCKSQGQRGA